MVGADGSTYTQPGEWGFNMSARALRSTDHYNQDVEQLQRQTLGTYVVNLQRALDLTLSYQKTERLSFSTSVPFISASWSIPRPTAPTPGPRAQEDAGGLGDIVVAARSWMLNPKKHQNGNFSLGVGLKLPTGKSNATDEFVGSNGLGNAPRYVDMSVQPGDGGWGVTTEITGFKRIKRSMIFASANYLINPRDTSGTPTNGQLIGSTPSPLSTQVNSVPDQYLLRVGGSIGIGKGWAASAAWRAEGLPRYDLVGQSHGFRRPGIELFIEPGISYSTGRNSFSVTVPWGYYRNRFPNPYTGSFGDATFPRFIVLGTYSTRFGKPASQIGIPRGPVATATEGALGAEATPLPTPSVQPGQAVVRLNVSGMTCDQCVDTVRAALVKVKGVVSADVSLAGHEAVVVYEEGQTTPKDLINAVKRAKGMNPYSAEVQQQR